MTGVRYNNRPAPPIPLPPSVSLLGNEPSGLAVDFCALDMFVRDTTTPANNFQGAASAKLTYSAPSSKLITNGFGVLEAGTTLRCDHDPATLDTSATSQHSLGVNTNKTFVTAGAVTYVAGQDVQLTAASDVTKWMLGRVVSYAGGSLVVTIYAVSGYFSTSSWKIIVALGIAVEGAATNLLLQSQAIDNAFWTVGGATVTANTVTAPDGTLTADTLVEDSSTGTHRLYRTAITLAAASPIAFSFFAKRAAGTRHLFAIIQNSANLIYCRIDMGTGAVIQSGAGGDAVFAACTVDKYPGGWYRVKLSGTSSTSTANPAIQVYMADTNVAGGSTPPSYAGDGASGLSIWGLQAETNVGGVAQSSSYIPTTTAQVTRAADNISLPATSMFYNASAGTLLATLVRPNALQVISGGYYATPVSMVGPGGLAGIVMLSLNSGNLQSYVGNQFVTNIAALIANKALKAGVAYDAASFIGAAGGSLSASSANPAIPNPVNNLYFGKANVANGYLAGWLKSVVYLPRKLSNSELQARTT